MVLLRGHDHEVFAARSAVDIERLRVGRPHGGRLEGGVHVELGRCCFGERGVDVHAIARGIFVMLKNARPCRNHQAAAGAADRATCAADRAAGTSYRAARAADRATRSAAACATCARSRHVRAPPWLTGVRRVGRGALHPKDNEGQYQRTVQHGSQR